ncbi:cytochrome c1-like [Procambarus clarkii]|uniref:cytochrome c1-like n=1 Tax=Procambarus clarkii TaxID=6728 RepID=UPI0037443FFA
MTQQLMAQLVVFQPSISTGGPSPAANVSSADDPDGYAADDPAVGGPAGGVPAVHVPWGPTPPTEVGPDDDPAADGPAAMGPDLAADVPADVASGPDVPAGDAAVPAAAFPAADVQAAVATAHEAQLKRSTRRCPYEFITLFSLSLIYDPAADVQADVVHADDPAADGPAGSVTADERGPAADVPADEVPADDPAAEAPEDTAVLELTTYWTTTFTISLSSRRGGVRLFQELGLIVSGSTIARLLSYSPLSYAWDFIKVYHSCILQQVPHPVNPTLAA